MLDPHQLFLCFVRVTGLGIGDEVVVGPPNGHVCHIRHAPSGGGLQITHEETQESLNPSSRVNSYN